MLIRHLPKESALVRELYGDQAEWGLGEHLLATAVDQLAIGNWLFVSANSAEDADRPPRPDPLPRPGIDPVPDRERSATPEEIGAFFSTL
ncbi:hypothetical protein [Kutzneria albida]|uniref:Uncharacterized protein n=1 Tax=Kutzneria albida DSM 43870 TaxID=1449976 RepID=W5W912_9PSEU|nr:hypothetical protein [Kutzneria albida]AHH97225.1 hypothetical protein KALB_3861 [Kutzneria albida DSM 43870]